MNGPVTGEPTALPEGAWNDARQWRARLVFWFAALAVGLAAILFAHLADWSAATFRTLLAQGRYWPFLVTPLTFALLAWLTRGWLSATRGSGIPQVIAALQLPDERTRNRLLGLDIAVGKMALTIAALLGGGSVGREGPTVHVGAGLMHFLGARFKFFDQKMSSRLILAGGAAGIAAAFNTPLAGVVFAIEELAGAWEQRLSGVVLTAVMIAGAATLGLIGNYAYFGRIDVDLALGIGWLAVPACAIVCGLAGGLFARLLLLDPGDIGLRRIAAWRTRMPVLFAAGCGLLLASLGWLADGSVYGTGYDEARAILQGGEGPGPLFAGYKFTANVLSYWAGVPGGIFSPALAVGAGIGETLSTFVPGIDISALALLGMCGYLSGVTQAPLTSAVICMELTANQRMIVPVLATALLSRWISRALCRTPIYHALAKRALGG